ncbi:ATP-binding cassette domain-containing protein [Streptomyces sp. NPDC127190]|uniref:ATP-binding cassette domain-containing protein n=1 Tax=unclassified Streptomyces TaxID=2593676 RepID=UPI00362B3085
MIQAFGLTSAPRKAHPPVVDDVSFEARAGQVTALLGASGSGKSTVLRLMLELQPGRGITYFRGRPLHRIAHPSREVGVLLGDVPGHPARSVRGHLRMLCAASGVPARRADEVLEVVGLVSLREERLGSLSRGMDRRLGLAGALLPDPHTLVLDEPSDGLSAREAQWLHSMLRAHADQGGTVLLTTADPKEAARTTDRVVTLDGGRLVADQDAREFARTRLRPRVAVRSPHATRLAALITKEARTSRRSVEVVHEGGNRLSVYGSTTADVGEMAFRHGILVHQLADEVGDMGPGAGAGVAAVAVAEGGAKQEQDRTRRAGERQQAVPGAPEPGAPAAVGRAGAAESGPAEQGDAPPAATVEEREQAPAVRPPAERGQIVFGFSVADPAAVAASHQQDRTVAGLSSAEAGRTASATRPGERAPSDGEERAGLAGALGREAEPDGAACVTAVPSSEGRLSAEGVPTVSAEVLAGVGTVPAAAVTATAHLIRPTAPEPQGDNRTAAVDQAPKADGSPGAMEQAPEAGGRHPSFPSRSPGAAGPTVEGPEPRTGGESAAAVPEPLGQVGCAALDPEPQSGANRAASGVEAQTGGNRAASGREAQTGNRAASGPETQTDGRRARAESEPQAGPTATGAGAQSGGDRTPAATPSQPGHDRASAGPRPRTGGKGIPSTRTPLPEAGASGPRQSATRGGAQPGGVRALDALSTLPPPISVRPAPSPLRPLRYEIRRAAGIGTGFLTCGAVLVVSALTAVLLARLGHTPQERLFAAWPRELPLAPAALGAGLLGALAFGDEFRHPALAADRGTVPRRLGLLAAKLLVSGVTAALLAFLTLGCDAEVLYIVYGRELTQVPGDWLSLTAGWFCLVIGCAWAGVLAAGVFRSTTAGLATVLAVPVVVVPLVHQVLRGPAVRMAAGFPARMREVLLLQWPFGGDRYLLGAVRILAQPVGGALALSLTALLCAYLFTTLRTRFR